MIMNDEKLIFINIQLVTGGHYTMFTLMFIQNLLLFSAYPSIVLSLFDYYIRINPLNKPLLNRFLSQVNDSHPYYGSIYKICKIT